METIKDLLSGLITQGGLATGMVLSIISAVILLLSDMLRLDHTTLALAWVMVAFVFAIGFATVRRLIREYEDKYEAEPFKTIS